MKRSPIARRLRISVGAADDTIQREASVDLLPDLRGLHSRRDVVWHDYQQIDVGIVRRIPGGMRTEQNDPRRVKLRGQLLNERVDAMTFDHSRKATVERPVYQEDGSSPEDAARHSRGDTPKCSLNNREK
jgi:hypothetical protein